MFKGYLTPPVVIVLALITLFVAATLFINTGLLKNIKNQSSPKPTTSEITNWETYTDNTYSFSFKYPETWYYKTIAYDYPDEENSIRFFKVGEVERISMMMAKGNEQLTLRIENDLNWDDLKSNYTPESQTQIGNRSAIKYSFGTYILIDEKQNTVLNIYRARVYSPEDYELLDQILSTLKFLD